MKTYKHLWEQFISRENFELAAKKAVRSKKSHKSVKYFLEHKDELLEKLRNDLITGKYKTSPYVTFDIYEPKKRTIYKLPLYPDHVLHHALINILGPIWQKSFIRDSFACIPGRGLLAASQRTMHFIRKNKYALQCDIRKFYPSISHDIIMKILIRKIRDRRILRVLDEIVRSVGGGYNLPIGNLTSQWLGNVYMNVLDNFVKQNLRWRHYIRYCDDFCLYGNNKCELYKMGAKIQNFVRKELGIEFSKCIVRRTYNGIGFIGYRHFRKYILVRKSTARKLKRRILNIVFHNDYGWKSVGRLAAAFGWLKWCQSFNFRKKCLLLCSDVKSIFFIRQNLFHC